MIEISNLLLKASIHSPVGVKGGSLFVPLGDGSWGRDLVHDLTTEGRLEPMLEELYPGNIFLDSTLADEDTKAGDIVVCFPSLFEVVKFIVGFQSHFDWIEGREE